MINDIACALAAGSKWGDYDPARLRTEPVDEGRAQAEEGGGPPAEES